MRYKTIISGAVLAAMSIQIAFAQETTNKFPAAKLHKTKIVRKIQKKVPVKREVAEDYTYMSKDEQESINKLL